MPVLTVATFSSVKPDGWFSVDLLIFSSSDSPILVVLVVLDWLLSFVGGSFVTVVACTSSCSYRHCQVDTRFCFVGVFFFSNLNRICSLGFPLNLRYINVICISL